MNSSPDSQLWTTPEGRTLLEQEILPQYIPRCRWFGGKARTPRSFKILDTVAIGASGARLVFVEIEYSEGPADHYQMPMQFASGETASALVAAIPGALIAQLADGMLVDALHDEAFRAGLFELMIRSQSTAGDSGRVLGVPGPNAGDFPSAPASQALAVEQSNSSIIYGDQIFLKLYRRLEEGVNPDAEILRFLGAQNFPHVPAFCGAVEYHPAGGQLRILALAAGVIPNDGDAWSFTLRQLTTIFERLNAGDQPGAAALEAQYLTRAAQLGQRTGALHKALAVPTDDPDFASEPLSGEDLGELSSAVRASISEVRRLIEARVEALDADTAALAHRWLDAVPAYERQSADIQTIATTAAKTRTHGDYHLGQVLNSEGDFVIIDFEGEPLRSIAERRRKRSPLRDVAGMLRSFHYAAHSVRGSFVEPRASLIEDAEQWTARAVAAFLTAWQTETEGAVFRDPNPAIERALLDAFLLEKALYEVRYEVNNRPTWLNIPLRGVLGLLR